MAVEIPIRFEVAAVVTDAETASDSDMEWTRTITS